MILEIGSINVDYIIHNKRLPVPGETIYGKGVTIMGGGKGANQIAAAARLGAETVLLSKIGGLDHYNDTVMDDLRWANVNTDFVETVPDVYSGSGYVLVNETGQNSIIIILGANGEITPAYVDKNKACMDRAKICMVEFMIPMETCEHAIRTARKQGIVTLVNPAPSSPIDDSFYPYIDIITPNEIEAADFCGFAITNEESASEACTFFHNKGVKNVIITMGSRGAFVSDGKERMMVNSYKVNALDTSGAGDSFNGGFAYAYWRGCDLFTAAHFGNAVASLSVQRVGTMKSMPTLVETEQVMKLPVL
ncbi:MAG: ribokinase [Christensenella sp.]|uniref:ribokinase n=1 Tax=Christensenella sp. TaxID=1935934 RepID=UPI002B21B9AA|nr:ribokinase [Christensenella sp.]MEA5001941.1 ribokinase [Christensenella sp.]